MIVDSRKPKQWVGVASGPSCRSSLPVCLPLCLCYCSRVLLYYPTCLCLAPVLLCLTLSAQPCPALNTITTSSTATIRTLSNPVNSTHYCFLNSQKSIYFCYSAAHVIAWSTLLPLASSVIVRKPERHNSCTATGS
jgi:hypothetical protein